MDRSIPPRHFLLGAAALAALYPLLRRLIPARSTPKTYSSPLEDLDPSISATAYNYPPRQLFPGSRDVQTPYGSIRLYEFGPADSPHRICFLHGISTPCISLAGIAESLAAHGCRVLLLDLWGRGWSGGPADLPYDGRLYSSQILSALATSDVSWTGASAPGGPGFTLVGYSLGGGLAVDFTSYFPELVRELVLLAPGGILRLENVNYRSYLLYWSGMFPEPVLQWLVGRRLRTTPNASATTRVGVTPSADVPHKADAESAPAAEIPEDAKMSTRAGTEVDMAAAVNWQIEHHRGFLPAFISSIRNAPIHEQHARWRVVGDRLRAQRALTAGLRNTDEGQAVLKGGLDSGKVLMVFGRNDPLVDPAEVVPDATPLFGEENMTVKIYEGVGHEVAISCATQIADEMWEVLQAKYTR